jgi:hypothetical protein
LLEKSGVNNEGILLKAVRNLIQKGLIPEYLRLVEVDENGYPILDENGFPKLSRTLKKKTLVHQEGDWHITVHGIIVDKREKF